MNYFSSNFKLGILGGGQLGKMLLYSTRKFDIYTCVLDPSEQAPCKIACNELSAAQVFTQMMQHIVAEKNSALDEAAKAIQEHPMYEYEPTYRLLAEKIKELKE